MYLEQVMKVAVNMIVKIVVKWAVLVLIIFIVNFYSCRTVLVATNAPRKPDLSAPSNGWDCRSDWHIHINLFKPLVSWLHKSITHSFAHFLHLAQFSFSSLQFAWVLSPPPTLPRPTAIRHGLCAFQQYLHFNLASYFSLLGLFAFCWLSANK